MLGRLMATGSCHPGEVLQALSNAEDEVLEFQQDVLDDTLVCSLSNSQKDLVHISYYQFGVLVGSTLAALGVQVECSGSDPTLAAATQMDERRVPSPVPCLASLEEPHAIRVRQACQTLLRAKSAALVAAGRQAIVSRSTWLFQPQQDASRVDCYRPVQT